MGCHLFVHKNDPFVPGDVLWQWVKCRSYFTITDNGLKANAARDQFLQRRRGEQGPGTQGQRWHCCNGQQKFHSATASTSGAITERQTPFRDSTSPTTCM